MTPASRLKAAMADVTDRHITPTAYAAGCPARAVRRARSGIPINADAHLKLCAALGSDPVTGAKIEPHRIGDLHWQSLATALRIGLLQRHVFGLRPAGKVVRVSYSAIGRVKRGEPVAIENVLKVCKYLKRHPFDFVSPVKQADVPRETVTETPADAALHGSAG